jgi:hypothetical protein
VQLEAFARLQKRARHPAGREPEQPAGFGKGAFDQGLNIAADLLEGGNSFHE